jgi:biopolymer transport protein ExbD
MAKSTRRLVNEVNAGSMADIAFLLLIFFLVTTQIKTDKGLTFMLPPDNNEPSEFHARNIFKIFINSGNELQVEGERFDDLAALRERIKDHVLNNGKEENLSISPDKAVVSIKIDRGTSYEKYIAVLDEVQGAYYEIYGERVGMSADDFRKLDASDPRDIALREKARKGIPMAISLAEPTNYTN